MADAEFTLSRGDVGFIESGVRIVVASRDTQNRPLLGHAAGCRVAPDRQRITLFLARPRYPLLIDAIRRTGAIAAVFTEPSSNKAIQLKGRDAAFAAVETGDAARMAAYLDLFVSDLERIGSNGALARGALRCGIDEVAAIAFTASAAFVQTPGPRAGSRIGR